MVKLCIKYIYIYIIGTAGINNLIILNITENLFRNTYVTQLHYNILLSSIFKNIHI